MVFLHSLFELFTGIENWSIESIFSAFSILLAIFGGLFAYRQWSLSNKTKRSEFINQIIEKLRFDESLVKTMYMIEYDYKWYNSDFYGGSKIEARIDKLLSYLSYICYLYKLKNISKREFEILQYEINRVCSSFEIQCYLWNLYHFSRKHGMNCSFQYLIDYGIRNKIIDEKIFNDSKPLIYPKHLNF